MKAGNMRNNRGFTLAELLVAVALVGILVSVSVVIFSGRTAEAKENVCKTNRDSMQHGTVVISMTERMNWLDEYGTGGVNSKVSEEIISYLLTEGYIDDFKCPAGGTIYAADVREDLVTFKCTYHDDGMEPGEENANNQAAKDLADAVNKYIQRKPPGQNVSNSGDVKDFLQTDDKKFIVKDNAKGILNDSIIDYLADQMVEIGKITEANKEKFKESLKKYREEEQYLVPYIAASATNQNKVLTYFVSESEYNRAFINGTTMHGSTSLICYDGKWYLHTNVNGNKNGINPGSIMTAFTDTKDIVSTIENLKEQKRLIEL